MTTAAIQSLALLTDAYRELNSKKLFWVTLLLSGMAVAAFAAFGINQKGITFLWFQFDTPVLTTDRIAPEKFYKFAFANVGIPIWLTWAATILALVSTASIFPEFIAGGAIELTLSKPISRLRLFFTKYLTGLLFVALQVFAFSLACFIVIGVRGSSWEPRLFLAVPIVLVFFSYLYCTCVLLGLRTRSTIASLLLTMLVWIGLFGINAADELFLLQRETATVNAERAVKRVEAQEKAANTALSRLREAGQPTPAEQGPLDAARFADELEAANPFLRQSRADATDSARTADRWRSWSGWMFIAKSILPKTGETTALLDRWLLSDEDKRLFGREDEEAEDIERTARFGDPDPQVRRRFEAAVRARSPMWVLGTSLGFEAVILAIAAWIFCRRDF